MELVRRAPADPRDRDQAEPGREAGRRRRAAQGEAHARRSRPSAASPLDRDCISPAAHTRVSTTSTRCSTSSSDRRRDRPAGRHQVRGRRDRRSGATSPRLVRHHRPRRSTSSRSTAAKAAPAPRRWSSPITSACRSRSASAACSALFAERGLHERVVFIGSGKLGFPDAALVAFALGCDMINVGREAMLSIGCIQAQRCHTNHCPTGVTTQNPWLTSRPRSDAEVGAARELHRDAAERNPRAQPRVRRDSSVAGAAGSDRDARRSLRRADGRRSLRRARA